VISVDLNYTPEEDRFRERVRKFLKDNLPAGWGTKAGSGSLNGRGNLEFMRDWTRKLYDNGFLGMSWPKEFGGQGASQVELAILNEEMARCRAPSPLNYMGLTMTGPTLIAHGTEEQKKRFIGKILTGEELWCQGFSEPGAGSDLAALRTRAELKGDEFVVNGQKVWTSGAHYADWCFLLVRTDPAAPKHRGISYLLVDMKTPGITVKPLRQMTGEADFNEVFFEDVRVPRENLVGRLNEGWRVAVTTLSNERGTMAFALAARYEIIFHEVAELCRRYSGGSSPVARQQVAQFYIDLQALKYSLYRNFSKILHGETPGPEGSIAKLWWSEMDQRMEDFAVQLLGPAGQLMDGSPHAVDSGRWSMGLLRARCLTIAAGTSEIHRNTIAERILGMPKGR
jgi:alkylation response protein AidB-like acyl-CoA dehydrogenase